MDETVYGMGKEETKTRTQEQDSGESRGKAKLVSTSDSGAKVEMQGNLGKSEEEGQKENEFESGNYQSVKEHNAWGAVHLLECCLLSLHKPWEPLPALNTPVWRCMPALGRLR